jgi:hypothetical protein
MALRLLSPLFYLRHGRRLSSTYHAHYVTIDSLLESPSLEPWLRP